MRNDSPLRHLLERKLENVTMKSRMIRRKGKTAGRLHLLSPRLTTVRNHDWLSVRRSHHHVTDTRKDLQRRCTVDVGERRDRQKLRAHLKEFAHLLVNREVEQKRNERTTLRADAQEVAREGDRGGKGNSLHLPMNDESVGLHHLLIGIGEQREEREGIRDHGRPNSTILNVNSQGMKKQEMFVINVDTAVQTIGSLISIVPVMIRPNPSVRDISNAITTHGQLLLRVDSHATHHLVTVMKIRSLARDMPLHLKLHLDVETGHHYLHINVDEFLLQRSPVDSIAQEVVIDSSADMNPLLPLPLPLPPHLPHLLQEDKEKSCTILGPDHLLVGPRPDPVLKKKLIPLWSSDRSHAVHLPTHPLHLEKGKERNLHLHHHHHPEREVRRETGLDIQNLVL